MSKDSTPKKSIKWRGLAARETTQKDGRDSYTEKEPTDDKKTKVTLRDLRVVRDVQGGFGHVIQRGLPPQKGEAASDGGDDEEDEKPAPDN